jgi:hypothetical protein
LHKEFNQNYLDQTKDIEATLLSRAAIKHYPTERPVLLSDEKAAGPAPFGDLANYLDMLGMRFARR